MGGAQTHRQVAQPVLTLRRGARDWPTAMVIVASMVMSELEKEQQFRTDESESRSRNSRGRGLAVPHIARCVNRVSVVLWERYGRAESSRSIGMGTGQRTELKFVRGESSDAPEG